MFPDHSEGELSAYRAALVKNTHLAKVAREIHLDDYLIIEQGVDDHHKISTELANSIEAIFGKSVMKM